MSVGDEITVTSSNGVNVRQTPGGTYLGGQPYGAVGTITAGPQNATYDGVLYTWWDVDFTSGSDGWVVQGGIDHTKYTLMVASSNPTSGVAITVTPTDNQGGSSGSTSFTRQYNGGTLVTLTAPSSVDSASGPVTFNKWTINGNDHAGTTVSFYMYGSYTATATYLSAGTVTHTLSIASINPSSGVLVTSSSTDVNGNAGGYTEYSRVFAHNTTATYMATGSINGNNFQKWLRDGADYTTSQTANITVDGDHTLTAVYAAPPARSTYTLTVASSNPSSGVHVSVSPADNQGLATADTTFTRQYNYDTVVTLVAPSTVTTGSGIMTFNKWTINGSDHADTTVSFGMYANYTATAVYLPASPVTHTLTIASADPDSGALIVSNSTDVNGKAGGNTTFTRVFAHNATATFIANGSAGGNPFQKWLRDGMTYTTSQTATVTVDADHTLTAVFASTGANTPTPTPTPKAGTPTPTPTPVPDIPTPTPTPSSAPISGSPQPDLIPSNVTVSRSSVTLGDHVTVSLKVTNQGDGAAIASKTRLRISTSSSRTTAADASLGDIDTPALPAHSSVDISKDVSITGVVAGTYYLWVSLDNTSVTSQSDGTNDYAHSQPIQAAAQQTQAATVGPMKQNINADGTVTLAVPVSGSGVFSFQWKRDNLPSFTGADGPSIDTSTSGSYTATVFLGGNVIGSASTQVSMSTPDRILRAVHGNLICKSGTPNKAAPTVVLTHGWEPIDNTMPPMAISDLAAAIQKQLKNVNVFIYVWPQAYTPWAGAAFSASASAGADLAAQLMSDANLGAAYDTTSHPIQFIGHSFGTFVNAYAIAALPWQIQEATLLDAPINVEAWAGTRLLDERWTAGLPSASIFYSTLDPTHVAHVKWVDSYIATDPYLGFMFGGPIAGAAPDGVGERVPNVNHKTIVPNFYTGTVRSSRDGFGHSAVLRGGTSDLAAWQSKSLTERVLDNLTQTATILTGVAESIIDPVGTVVSDVWRFVGPKLRSAQTAELTSGSSTPNNVASAATESDTTLAIPVVVPAFADQLRFDFKIAHPTDGDWIDIRFNDQPLFGFLAGVFRGSDYQHVDVPVQNLRAQAGVVSITLHASSGSTTDFRIGNIRFAEAAANVASVDAGNLANISTRLRVGTDESVLIGGFIVSGSQSKKVLIRGLGPSLASANIRSAIADPMLELHDSSGALVATNDNWKESQQNDIQSTTIAPPNKLESAIVASLNPGSYTAVVRGNNNAVGTGLVEVYDLDSAADSRLANISTRGFVGKGDNVMIGGLIIKGDGPRRILVRGIGAALANAGVAHALADPVLELHDSTGAIIATNDDWQDTSNKQAIINTGLAPSDKRESAMLLSVLPGNYTAVLRGANNSTGVALVEAYDLGPLTAPH